MSPVADELNDQKTFQQRAAVWGKFGMKEAELGTGRSICFGLSQSAWARLEAVATAFAADFGFTFRTKNWKLCFVPLVLHCHMHISKCFKSA